MKALGAGLIFVNTATLSAVFLGLAGRGLSPLLAGIAFAAAVIFAGAAWLAIADSDGQTNQPAARPRYPVWLWFVGACFAMFAFRSFCWLLYRQDAEWMIQSPNNLGDLALHLTYIKTFASGLALWPDNPIYIASKLRYPAGTDIFNALLTLAHVDLLQGLAWAGLAGSVATFYALWRWGREFGLAGFLFNGGVAGFQLLNELWANHTMTFRDFQGDKEIAWKSIPLAMFVTQRGWLYALPVGFILLWHWRRMFRLTTAATDAVRRPDESSNPPPASPAPGGLPFWVELLFYATLPLFHAHTFLALSAVLVFLFAAGGAAMRRHVAWLIGSAFLPATFFVWLISDNFRAGSMLQWHPGWVLHDHDLGRSGWFDFWFTNFGILPFLVIALFALCWWRARKNEYRWNATLAEEVAFLGPALAILVAGMLFKFAPWDWDSLKIMIWAYFLILPFLWSRLIATWSIPLRTGVCVALFGSGFATLFGGLAAGRPGFGFVNRGELAGVEVALRQTQLDARFATFPTYNHPVLLQGRKVVMGYPGHLWTQGFNYGTVESELKNLMNGTSNWRQLAQALGVRYIFWGREEKMNYPQSPRPWETSAAKMAEGDWGAIYDLQAIDPTAPRTLRSTPKPFPTPKP
jgi:hypothetical protein